MPRGRTIVRGQNEWSQGTPEDGHLRIQPLEDRGRAGKGNRVSGEEGLRPGPLE